MRSNLLLWILLAAFSASSHGAPVYPTKAETKQLLESNQFEVLNQRYGDIQAAYRNGEISEENLLAAFRTFYDPDFQLGKNFEVWVMFYPKSYVAHLARGIYWKYVGMERRGTNFASETSDDQFEAMHAANRIAALEFETSLSLETKPLLSYHHAIDIATDDGDHRRERALLDKAIALDPATLIVRMKYMGALRTRWGGSVEQMKEFLAECRKAGLTIEQLKSLESMVLEDEAWVARYHQHDDQRALGPTTPADRSPAPAQSAGPRSTPCGMPDPSPAVTASASTPSDSMMLVQKARAPTDRRRCRTPPHR